MLDCSSLPVKEATTAWQESIGVMFDTRLRNAPDSGFRAHVEGFQFGDLLLGSCHSVAQTFDRSPRRIKRDNLDHLLLQFYTEGTCGQRDGGLDARTQPGDLWISDLAQPQATAASDFTNPEPDRAAPAASAATARAGRAQSADGAGREPAGPAVAHASGRPVPERTAVAAAGRRRWSRGT